MAKHWIDYLPAEGIRYGKIEMTVAIEVEHCSLIPGLVPIALKLTDGLRSRRRYEQDRNAHPYPAPEQRRPNSIDIAVFRRRSKSTC